MSKRNITSGVVGLLVAAISTVTVTAAAQSAGTDGQRKRPQLVVGIVVEGLTMDYLDLLRSQFTQGGFRRLLEHGVTVSDIDYGTPLDGAAASAVIFTGAPPSEIGRAHV